MIFRDDDDRDNFVEQMRRLLMDIGTLYYAWALIPNHFHLLLHPCNVELSRFIRRLLTGYAVTFNRRYKRSGHLFQNRYKSIVCEEEAYLLQLGSRYGSLPFSQNKAVSLATVSPIYRRRDQAGETPGTHRRRVASQSGWPARSGDPAVL